MWYDEERRLMIFEELLTVGKQFPPYTVVPLSIENCRELKQQGLPYVSPLYHYDWPIQPKWRPRTHQKQMAEHFVLHPHSFNLSDCGTQKTLASLWAADFLMQQNEGEKNKCLIVAPLSTLEDVWAQEIFYNLMGRRKYAILYGSQEKRASALDTDVDFYIINHDGVSCGSKNDGRRILLQGFAQRLANDERIKIIIYDEASAVKHATRLRSRVARHIFSQKPYLCAMTGTPAAQHPTDAYGIAKLVNNAQGKTFTSFRQEVMVPPLYGFKWLVKAGSEAKVASLLTPAIRIPSLCPDALKMSTQRRKADLSSEQERAYKQFKRDCVMQLKSGKVVTAVNEAVLRNKLIQISCGFIYDADGKPHFINAASRLKVLDEAIEECAQKILVFAPFTSIVSLLYKHLGESMRCAMVTGDTSAKERADIFRSYHSDPAYRCIVADPRCMAHGLTLTEATACIWYAPCESNEHYYQANERMRPGMTGAPTTAIQIYSTEPEKEIYNRLKEQASLQGAILKILEK